MTEPSLPGTLCKWQKEKQEKKSFPSKLLNTTQRTQKTEEITLTWEWEWRKGFYFCSLQHCPWLLDRPCEQKSSSCINWLCARKRGKIWPSETLAVRGKRKILLKGAFMIEGHQKVSRFVAQAQTIPSKTESDQVWMWALFESSPPWHALLSPCALVTEAFVEEVQYLRCWGKGRWDGSRHRQRRHSDSFWPLCSLVQRGLKPIFFQVHSGYTLHCFWWK